MCNIVNKHLFSRGIETAHKESRYGDNSYHNGEDGRQQVKGES